MQNKFDPQQTRNDLSVQNGFTQLGMMVSGEIATANRDKADRDVQVASAKLDADRRNGADAATIEQDKANLQAAEQASAFWSGAGPALLHMVAAGTGTALGGGNVAGAVAGSAVGDAASGALSQFTGEVTAGLPSWLRPLAKNIVNSTVSGVAGGLAGGVVGGGSGMLSGAGAAMSADQFNRQLHEPEISRIKELAGGDPQQEAALTAAACALVQCYAEYPEGSQEYIFWKQVADIGSSPAYQAQRDLLNGQTQIFGGGSSPGHSPPSAVPLFQYSNTDAVFDVISAFDAGHGQVITRGLGGLQIAGGMAAGLTGRALTISGLTSCAASFGGGCMVAAGGIVLTGWAADQVSAGLMTVSGYPTGTFGAQALVSAFGMSPAAAEFLYGLAGGAAASAAGSAKSIPGTVIIKDGEMTVLGQPGLKVEAYGKKQGNQPSVGNNVPDTGTGNLSDILLPGGEQVGVANPGAGRNIRTVTPEQFQQIQSELMQGATAVMTPQGYKGQWYQLPDGNIVGIRTSDMSGTTIDVIKSNNPYLPNGYKIHQQ